MTPPGPVNAGDVLSVTFTVPSNPVVAATTMTFTFPGASGPAIDTAQELVNGDQHSDPANNNATTGERYVNASVDAGGRMIIDNTTMGSLRLQWTPAAVVANADGPQQPVRHLRAAADGLDTHSTPAAMTAATNHDAREVRRAVQRPPPRSSRTSPHATRATTARTCSTGRALDMIFNEEASTRMLVRGVVFDYRRGWGFRPATPGATMQSDTEIYAGLAKSRQPRSRSSAPRQATFASQQHRGDASGNPSPRLDEDLMKDGSGQPGRGRPQRGRRQSAGACRHASSCPHRRFRSLRSPTRPSSGCSADRSDDRRPQPACGQKAKQEASPWR
jgi:hypothetical protein